MTTPEPVLFVLGVMLALTVWNLASKTRSRSRSLR